MVKNLTEKSFKVSKKMTIWGIGPKMILILFPFIVFFLILHFICFPAFIIPINYIYMIITGVILILIGAIIYIKSVLLINKAYFASELVTTGVYGYMRHPLYSAFILFISPGIVCIFNSWILFFIPILHYIIFRVLIKQEENYCLENFGEKYAHYKNSVHAIFPKLRKYKPL